MNDINLKQIIEQFPDCVTNGAKLKAILLDTYPEISKAIVNTLVIMANSGIAKEIQDSENITELDKSRWRKKLEDDYGLSEKIIDNGLSLFILHSENSKSEKNLQLTNLQDFEIQDGVLKKYKGNSSTIIIPDCVTQIADFAFFMCSNLMYVTIPNSVTKIGSKAFYGCTNLMSVTIGNNVTEIESDSFDCCSKLVEVINKSNLNITKGRFGLSYFNVLNIKKVGTTDIIDQNGYLFITINGSNYLICKVEKDTELTLPEKYNGQDYNIHHEAFRKCVNLKKITVADGNSKYISVNNCLIEKRTKNLILGCKNSIIPNDGSVTRIGSYAFDNCSGCTSITIPESVTGISFRAFGFSSSIKILIYSGTKQQWKNINKDVFWSGDIKEVHCKDGIIKIV